MTNEQSDRKTIFKNIKKSLLKILFLNTESFGTGFLIDGSYILTVAHNVEALPDISRLDESQIKVPLASFGGAYSRVCSFAEVCFVDPVSDVAILKEFDFNASLSTSEYKQFLNKLGVEGLKDYSEFIDDTAELNISKEKKLNNNETVFIVNWDGTEFVGSIIPNVGLPASMMITYQSGAKILSGTSGAPVVLSDGTVCGIVKSSNDNGDEITAARVPLSLPNWILDPFV